MGYETDGLAAAARERLKGLEANVRQAHADVVARRASLMSAEGSLAAVGETEAAVDGEDEEEASASLAMEIARLGPRDCLPLDDRVAAFEGVLRAALCEEGEETEDSETAPAEGLAEALADVWGVRDESAARTQLLSFVAAASLGEEVRTRALLTCSLTERLLEVLSGLRKEERRLAAALALRGASEG